MNYIKNNQITARPIISNVINPCHDIILANGWFEYIDNPPLYDSNTQRIEKIDVINGVQQYVIIDFTQEEITQRTVPQTITPAQGRIMLSRLGKLEDIENTIEHMDKESQIFWEYALTWNRSNSIVIQLSEQFGFDIDNLFIEASKIE
jgi:hypothetical protein